MRPRCRAIAALVRDLERPPERLNESTEKRRRNRKCRYCMGCFHKEGKGARSRNPGHVHHLTKQSRHSVPQECKIIRLEGRDACEPIDRGSDQQQNHERLTEPIQNTMQVMPSLSERKSGSKQWSLAKQSHLNRSKEPAVPLCNVFGYSLGRQSGAESLVQPPGLVTLRQHCISQIDIFRDRLARKSADFGQTIATNDKGRPYAECASPRILGRLKYIEKKALVVDPTLRGQQIVLDRIGIVIELRCLNDGHLRVRQQPNCALQEIAAGSKIRIQHQNNRGIGSGCRDRESVVQVSRLGIPVVVTSDIARTHSRTVFAEPPSPCIVQNPNSEIRIIQRQSGQNRSFQNLDWLV